MAGRAHRGGRKSLRRYEGLNLVLMLFAVVALAAFSTWVFQFYSNPDDESTSERGILSEVVIDSDVCMFTVGATLTHTARRYQSSPEVRPNDSLARDLFAIPGVMEVSIDKKSVILRKAPSARWDKIQPAARAVIDDYIDAQ